METDTHKNIGSYGVVRGRSLLLPATMVEEQRRKDVEVDAFFKQCDANIARMEEERIDQM